MDRSKLCEQTCRRGREKECGKTGDEKDTDFLCMSTANARKVSGTKTIVSKTLCIHTYTITREGQ